MTKKHEKYNIAVVANMSAGKSTLINAILGKDLLLSCNAACTCNVFKIRLSARNKDFQGRIPGNPFASVTHKNLVDWNSADCSLVELKGTPFNSALAENSDIVFYDTPGPNDYLNSQRTDLPKLGLKKRKIDFLICVLDYRYLGTDDETILLKRVKSLIKGRNRDIKLVFFVNQVDNYDERDNPLTVCYNNLKKKLHKMRFRMFTLLFGSAYEALLLRTNFRDQIKVNTCKAFDLKNKIEKHQYIIEQYDELYRLEHLSFSKIFLKNYWNSVLQGKKDEALTFMGLENTTGILMLENIIYKEMKNVYCR